MKPVQKDAVRVETEYEPFTLDYLVQEAELGNVYTILFLAMSYRDGTKEIPKNLDKAYFYALKLQALGEPEGKMIIDSLSWYGYNPSSQEKDFSIELSEYSCEKNHDYMITEGLVKNISTQPIKSLQVVVTHFTADNTFITSDTSHVEYQPLLPNQESPFKIFTRYNPAIDHCMVNFKSALDVPIMHAE